MEEKIREQSSGDDDVAYNNSDGDDMKVKLSDDDRRAVDMLLDRDGAARAGKSGNGGSTVAMATDGQFYRRIERAEAVLNLLAEMPAFEPPADLVGRVMRRIEEGPQQQRARPAAASTTNAPAIDGGSAASRAHA